MDDEAVIAALTEVNGIGRWTAEMFLMFNLNRPDVLPVDDLAFRKGMQLFFNLRRPPLAKAMFRLAEPWRPWRTVATWYIWRGSSMLERKTKA
jgi:DNA-3-methyladenine glycosylase II